MVGVYQQRISQYLTIAQQFELEPTMDNTDEPRSIDRYSATSSEGRKKQRPSLLPLRNSAKRYSALLDNQHPRHLTPIDPQHPQHPQSPHLHAHNHEGEDQHGMKSPSRQSVLSSPRTPKLSPREFEPDTPFVPFVHQSLIRTVWESEEVIPEQREQIERKQSQTEVSYHNASLACLNPQPYPDRQLFQHSHSSLEQYPDRQQQEEASLNPQEFNRLNGQQQWPADYQDRKYVGSNSGGQELNNAKDGNGDNGAMDDQTESCLNRDGQSGSCLKRDGQSGSCLKREERGIRVARQEFFTRHRQIVQAYQDCIGITRHVETGQSGSQEAQTQTSQECSEPNGGPSVSTLTTTLSQHIEDRSRAQVHMDERSRAQMHMDERSRTQMHDAHMDERNRAQVHVQTDRVSVKDFGCQYQQRDIGMKPSIKRVSIAHKKKNQIFNIDSNSTVSNKSMENSKGGRKKWDTSRANNNNDTEESQGENKNRGKGQSKQGRGDGQAKGKAMDGQTKGKTMGANKEKQNQKKQGKGEQKSEVVLQPTRKSKRNMSKTHHTDQQSV